MKVCQGIGVSAGIAIGEVMVFDNGHRRVQHSFIKESDTLRAVHRLENAMSEAAAQIENDRDSVTYELGEEFGHIFGAHLQLLSDK